MNDKSENGEMATALLSVRGMTCAGTSPPCSLCRAEAHLLGFISLLELDRIQPIEGARHS